jgi:hypothetical protein
MSNEKPCHLLMTSFKNVIASLKAQSNWQNNAVIEKKVV